MILRKIWSYIAFKKQGDKPNIYLRSMHGMNRISILMFLIAIVVMVIRALR